MPTSAVAKKAADTRTKCDARAVELVKQGTATVTAIEMARKQFRLKKLTAKQLPEHVLRIDGLVATGKGRRPRKAKVGVAQGSPVQGKVGAPVPAGSVTNVPATPVQTGSAAGTGPVSAKMQGATQGGSATPPASMQAAAASAAAAPDPDIAAKLAKTVGLVKPSWKVDGKFLKVTSPHGLKEVVLPREPKAGPYTPTEKIHDILGQPEMLFEMAMAFAVGKNVLLSGPTGVAKTIAFRWFAQQLNWNILTVQIHGGTMPEDLVGEFLPVEQQGAKSGTAQQIRFIYATVSKAALASQKHPTICVFEEINRIGNQQAYAKVYGLLDDTHQIEIPNKEDADGLSEVITAGKLYFGANMNPADIGYIGTADLDVAFGRRFPYWHEVSYPPPEIEAEALRQRVTGLSYEDAKKIVGVATRVRTEEKITYPICFPDMVAWAEALPYLGWENAAKSAVVNKAQPDDRAAINNVIQLRPAA